MVSRNERGEGKEIGLEVGGMDDDAETCLFATAVKHYRLWSDIHRDYSQRLRSSRTHRLNFPRHTALFNDGGRRQGPVFIITFLPLNDSTDESDKENLWCIS